MKMRTREIRWAAGGFLGGFLLCYLLVGGLRPQTPAPSFSSRAVPMTAETNIQLPGVRVLASDGWVEHIHGVPSALTPPGCALDLIDTRYQLPQAAEKP